MKTLAAVLIAMIVIGTASAEGWNQKIKRLEKENKELKARIVQLEQEVKKTATKKTGKQVTSSKNPQYEAYVKTQLAKAEKYKNERKKLQAELDNKYKFYSKSKKREKAQLLDRIEKLDKKIKRAESLAARFS